MGSVFLLHKSLQKWSMSRWWFYKRPLWFLQRSLELIFLAGETVAGGTGGGGGGCRTSWLDFCFFSFFAFFSFLSAFSFFPFFSFLCFFAVSSTEAERRIGCTRALAVGCSTASSDTLRDALAPVPSRVTGPGISISLSGFAGDAAVPEEEKSNVF